MLVTRCKVERQESFVELLEEAHESHPFPEYAARLEVEREKLERMRRRDGAWIIHLTTILAMVAIIAAVTIY